MKILILGGTRFVGKLLVYRLVQDGHNVTILTRGKNSDLLGERVKRIQCDRSNAEVMGLCLKHKYFDVVYDFICFSSLDAEITCNIFNLTEPNKYIIISSSYVYKAQDTALKEEEFVAKDHNVINNSSDSVAYEVGKRDAEAYFVKNAMFNVILVRFPIIMGWNDYTNRFKYHVDNILKSNAFYVYASEGRMNFIRSEDAVNFLYWLIDSACSGPINAASAEAFTGSELIKQFSLLLGHNTHIYRVCELKHNGMSCYSRQDNLVLDTSKASRLGYNFPSFFEWFYSEVEIQKCILM